MKTSCVFCNDNGILMRQITSNDLVFAFPTNIPIVPGHVLIAPRRCVRTMVELTREEHDAIFQILQTIMTALRSAFGAEGFNIAWNEGEVAGQSVPHLHLHVLPRKNGDSGITEYEPRKFLYRPGSRETSPEHELDAVTKLIQTHLPH
jgi:histidine triad (HIT) family protein